ncbi:MAG: J domain-containing protein [Solirubrobacteraceae bacterium]|nr:J domain-containing protein [Solirubrobacteraceae bacterium]
MNGHAMSLLCGTCGTPRTDGTRCADCGSNLVATLRDGFVVALPAGSMACDRCGTTRRPILFRGWVRLSSAIWWTRADRHAAYVCAPCGQKRTAGALLYSAALGWLAIPSWFSHGWKALATNWRALIAPPAEPEAWGALQASDFANGLPHLDSWNGAEFMDRFDDDTIWASPLGPLDEMQRRTVLAATALYETMGVSPVASEDELRIAYRERSKVLHPDVHADGTEQMIRLNQAWTILGNADMRAAYDWLREQRQPA